MNTPQTSPAGNVHGMPLACCIGLGPEELTEMLGFSPKVHPRNVALVGLRDVDILERPHVRGSGVRAFTMRDIDERGLRVVMEEALGIVTNGTAGFHARSTWIMSIRKMPRAWARPSGAARLTAKRIWQWK